MTFAGALTITDLDDFLTPSQACIIPVRGAKNTDTDGPTEIHIDSNNNYYEVSTYPSGDAGPSGSSKALEKAEINLNDCLACSGCITSTESMLITLQSHKEVIDFIAKSTHSSDDCTHEHPVRTPILSVSPQTLASLSAHYSAKTGKHPIPLRTLLRRIRRYLGAPSRGGWRVWDTTFARHVSLRESVIEFEERKKVKGKEREITPGLPEPGPLPMLASACPGWVCYAEKAQGDLLPMMSSARSSQAIMGSLAKSWFAQRMDLKPDQVYHVTAMPCYDKKLEASRSDFYSSLYSTRETDCVLTTGELDLLLEDLAFDPYLVAEEEEVDPPRDIAHVGCSPWPELLNHPGTSSGSYLSTIIASIAARHSNPTKLEMRKIRDSDDNVEYLLEDALTHEVIFKGAKCYGFRNLQNMVRKVGKETGIVKGGRAGASKLSAAIAARRRKKTNTAASTPGTPGTPVDSDAETMNQREDKKLDFVEVMACPGGCVNGGGQMKPTTHGVKVDEEGYPRPMADDGVEEGMRWSTKEWVAQVEEIYWSGLPTPPASPGTIPVDLVKDVDMDEGANGEAHWTADSADRVRLAEADQIAEEIVKQTKGSREMF